MKREDYFLVLNTASNIACFIILIISLVIVYLLFNLQEDQQ